MPIRLWLTLSALYNATAARTQADQTAAVMLNVHPARKLQSLLDKFLVPSKNELISTGHDLGPLAPANTHIGRSQLAETIRRGRSRSLPTNLAYVRQRWVGFAS